MATAQAASAATENEVDDYRRTAARRYDGHLAAAAATEATALALATNDLRARVAAIHARWDREAMRPQTQFYYPLSRRQACLVQRRVRATHFAFGWQPVNPHDFVFCDAQGGPAVCDTSVADSVLVGAPPFPPTRGNLVRFWTRYLNTQAGAHRAVHHATMLALDRSLVHDRAAPPERLPTVHKAPLSSAQERISAALRHDGFVALERAASPGQIDAARAVIEISDDDDDDEHEDDDSAAANRDRVRADAMDYEMTPEPEIMPGSLVCSHARVQAFTEAVTTAAAASLGRPCTLGAEPAARLFVAHAGDAAAAAGTLVAMAGAIGAQNPTPNAK
jgi:hypothetical protein